jgi:hypothetical protein
MSIPILNCPLCIGCLTHTAASTRDLILDIVPAIGDVATVRRLLARCHACGLVGPVIYITRASAT